MKHIARFVVAVVVLGALSATPVSAESPNEMGWWWSGRPSETFPAAFTPFPPVPEGGLYVAGTVEGPTGLSAVRFTMPVDAVEPVLVLAVEEAVGTLVLDACTASSAWDPAENGPWDQAPVPDCDAGRAFGDLSDDGTTVTLDLGSLVVDGALDIVLLPGRDPATAEPAMFSASFKAPGDDAFAVRMVEPEPDDDGDDDPEPDNRTTTGGTFTTPTFTPSRPGTAAPSVTTPAPTTARPSAQPRRARTAPILSEATTGFAYPIVLALPLLFLALGSTLAWTLTRPMVPTAARRPVL